MYICGTVRSTGDVSGGGGHCETELYRAQGAKGSRPAMKIRRSEVSNKTCKIKYINVRMNVMYNKYELYCYAL